jgi:hypothetical protein
VPERRTQLGSEVLEHLQGLREYLTIAEEDRLKVLQSPQGAQRTRVDPNDPAAVVKLYEKLLPWAIVWGVESEWSKVLGEQYAQTQTEPSNLQFSSGFSGLTGFATSVQTTSFAQTVTTSSYSGSGGGSSLCASDRCAVCRIIRHGFSSSKDKEGRAGAGVGVFTTSTSGRAFESVLLDATAAGADDAKDSAPVAGGARKALLVCRVIAGRVHKPLDNIKEFVGQTGFDSLAGKVGPYANIEELYLLNPRALLPCFVVICKP